MVTIVFTHPWHGSFNNAILETILTRLEEDGRKYQVIDLPKDNFHPALSQQDLALYGKGETTDPLVKKYQQMLTQTDELIFIFPIWWGQMPAILKGFFDKLLLKGFSYKEAGGKLVPLLNINKTFLISTSQFPTETFRPFIADYFIPYVLGSTIMGDVEWLNCDETSSGTDEHRQAFLDQVLMKI